MVTAAAAVGGAAAVAMVAAVEEAALVGWSLLVAAAPVESSFARFDGSLKIKKPLKTVTNLLNS